MSVAQTGTGFRDLLRKSGLVAAPRLAEISAAHAESTAVETSAALVAAGDITPFQAECLLDGYFRGFFIDRFKVLDILGGGGMGLLYLAEHCDTRERIALKVLTEVHKHDPAMQARFEIEAQAGMRLKHPTNIRILELGQADDLYGKVPFMAMEFVEGLELQELVIQKGGPLPWWQACDVIRQAAEGLHHAHEAGLVHRDMKPANLLLDATGAVKILDFGLALLDQGKQDEELSLTLIFGQGCLGTHDFIAPEQTCDSSTVDRRADIYSLGCTFYFALAGRVPFPVRSQEQKIVSHQERQPQHLKELVANTPAEVVSLVEKMMAKQPQQRFQTAAEVASALESLGKPERVEFDFPALLKERKQAVKRRAALHRSTRREDIPPASRSSITTRFYD